MDTPDTYKIGFEPARFSCGFGAIYNAMRNLKYNYSEHQLYFLGGGIDFDYIESIRNLGYKNLYKTYCNLKQFCDIQYLSGKILLDVIIDMLSKNKLILAYVNDNALAHQKLRVAIYPFHVLLIYGYEKISDKFLIADLYIIDSIGQQHTFIGKIDSSTISDNTIDCLVIGESKPDTNTDNIKKELVAHIAKYSNMKTNAVFQYTSELISKVKSGTIDSEQIAITMISSKWNVFLPFFECSIQLCRDYNLIKIKDAFEYKSQQLQQVLLRNAKQGYRRNYTKLIESIIDLDKEWRESLALMKRMSESLMGE